MSNLLYPRLNRSAARALVHERTGASLAELSVMSALTHSAAEPSATGGHPATTQQIEQVRRAIREVALAAGYPERLRSNSQRQSFDRPCGTKLYEIMGIVPADAAEEGVWSFLTLVVVPEIGPWRFPSETEERLLGQPRNVLRRTWWRAWALGPDLESAPAGCTPLGEDESVQIIERPSLGGNRRTAQAIQSAAWRAERDGLSVPRSELVRQLALRLRATKPHVLLDGMDDASLELLMDELIHKSVEHLSASN